MNTHSCQEPSQWRGVSLLSLGDDSEVCVDQHEHLSSERLHSSIWILLAIALTIVAGNLSFVANKDVPETSQGKEVTTSYYNMFSGLIACVASDVMKTSECGYCKCKSVQESSITASPTTETIVHVNCSGVTSGSGQIRVPNLTEYLKSNSLSSGELWIEFNGNGIRNISNLKLPNIDLSSNAFTSVSQTLLDWKMLQTVDLQDNPWHCECSLQWMLDIVVAKLYKADQQLLYNLKCASPAIVAEKRMVHFYNWTKPAFCSGFEQLRMKPGQSDPTSSSWLGTSNAAIIVVCSLLGVLVLLVALGIFLQRKISARRRIKNRRENGAAEPETAVARYRLSPVTSLDWKDKMLHVYKGSQSFVSLRDLRRRRKSKAVYNSWATEPFVPKAHSLVGPRSLARRTITYNRPADGYEFVPS
uniref:LRRCT domain-containing protein n=1 Tax=Timema bartmani TaxID=61472 RepID=A0A7R9I1Z7_9NEOP|nr:unnamed protein product [Timema bartmani]